MFTLLPSLYLIGVHYFRQWKASSYDEHVSILKAPYYGEHESLSKIPSYDEHESIPKTSYCDEHESIPKTSNDQIQKVKTRRKKSNNRRRKTSISELSHDDIIYLINETGFTREKILIWYADFLNDCPDGKLSKSKFIDIYQEFYKKGQVGKFCEYAFRLFNKDGSGYLDFMEFLLAVSLASSKDPVRKIELFFSMYDVDHNGLIDENEMRSFVESIYELMGIDISDPSRIDSKVHQIFSNAKCDPLGYLRKDQFAIACENDRHIRKLLISNTKSFD